MHGRHLGLPRGVAEEHAAGEGVGLYIGEPGVEGAGEPLFGRVVAGEALGPDLLQVGGVAFEQLYIAAL
ncbi:MAG: hypothetical protein JWM24_186 [Solirubrobacterales bacterium]|nr:hypothetical protein [Solirubrobacterales bacterium]